MGDISGRTRLDANLRFGPNNQSRVSVGSPVAPRSYRSLALFLAGRFPLNAHTGRHSHEGSLDSVRGPPRLPASPECGAIVWFADTKSSATPEYPRAVISRTFTFGGFPGEPDRNPLCLCERELSARGLRATWALSLDNPARRCTSFAVCCLLFARQEMKLKKLIVKIIFRPADEI